ncbi:hypothetical protein WJX75_006689 [Coccomyxa subellipsoidea]|uniref:Uncharacterized protein n=1 Tax=Coccomyxa subellipsoidea TaxID=248742 RepID=A0ABR2Z0B9_9CHLO
MQVPFEDRKQLFEQVSEAVNTTEAETTPMQGIEEGSDGIPKTKSRKHRPSQLSVDDIDLSEDFRSPHPAIQRTPVPVTPQSASSVSSSAVEILRTPMPFGSPVPDPRHTTTFAQTLGDAAGQKRPSVNQPAYNKLPCNVPFELRHVERAQSNPETPTNPFQTPSPLESDRRYAVSSQDPDSTPHIFGLSNPATVYKENKAIRLRHTPFNERVDKEVQKERRFSERLSTEKAATGQNT